MNMVNRLIEYRRLGPLTAVALIINDDGERVWRYRDGSGNRNMITIDRPYEDAVSLDHFLQLIGMLPATLSTGWKPADAETARKIRDGGWTT